MRSRSYIATPPGATIKEQLIDRGMSQKEFAVRLGMSEKHISKLINGDVQLTIDMARKLEIVLGVPAQFWCNLESIYREKIAKVNEENAMDEDVDFVKNFPYKEMAQNGWVIETSNRKERVSNLRKYFEVVQLSFLRNNLVPAGIACRKLSETEKSYYALVAWAQKAKIESRKMNTQPINIQGLREEITVIRNMTIMRPDEFCPKLQQILAMYGIAIVFLPHIGGSFLHGVTFTDGDKIVLGLTVRGKDADKFWFSLFHELGHIILGHIQNVNGTTQEDEVKADMFSENILIPERDFSVFTKYSIINKNTILEFARMEGVDAGIVIGRLQKYGYVRYDQYNELKKKYEIA